MSFYTNVRIKIVSDGKNIRTKTGTPMASSFGYVDVGGEDDFALGVVAFGHIAPELAKVKKGETIAVQGNLQANNYTKQDGTEIKGFQVVADSLMSVRRAMPLMQERKPKQHSPTKKQITAQNDFYESSMNDLNF